MAYSCEEILKRGDDRFGLMGTWLTYWQAVAEIFYPERADFISQGVEGAERYVNIFAGEPIMFRDRFCKRIGALCRPANQQWFKAKIQPTQVNTVESIKRWCESVTETQRDEIYSPIANFGAAMLQSDNDYGTFGDSIVWHGWGRLGNRGRLLFECKHPRDIAYFVNPFGVVDEVHEKICDKSIEEWARLFAKVGGTLPEDWLRKLRDKKGAEKVDVRRVVLPVERYNEYGKISGKARDMRFASLYIAVAEKHEIHCDGFKVFPYWVRRWMNVSGELRGRSPCVGVAMADARVLNTAQRSLLEALEKAVDPPTLLPHDGVIGDVEIFAGGRIMYDAERGMRARDLIDQLPPGDVKAGIEFTESRRMFMNQAWYGDVLRRLPEKEMTAFETQQWLDEYIVEIMPIVVPMETDNALLMEANFERLFDAGRFPEPPQEALGRDVAYEFDTPVTRAYRKQRASTADMVVARTAALTEAGQPQVADNVDWDKLYREASEGDGAPLDWFFTEDEVAETREQRQAADAAKAAAALAMQEQARQDGMKSDPNVDKASEMMGVPTAKGAPMQLAAA